MERNEYNFVGLIIFIFGTCGLMTNAKLYRSNKLKKEKGNIIIGFFSLINISLIVLSYPLIIISYGHKEWQFGNIGCTYYGFLALFLGFAQMHVPILLSIDTYLSQSDSQYDTNKNEKRKKLILISFLISLFWGGLPLFGYPKMTFEPCGVSCSVYEPKPGMDYIAYIIGCLFFFEIIPLLIFAFCKINTKDHKETFARHFIAIITLIIAWAPLTTVYVWPIFGNSENMSIRLSLYAPPFAKLTALVLPVILNY